MSSTHRQPTLLEELDRRQNDVLDQLDQLEGRVLQTLGEWTRATPIAAGPAAARAPTQ